MTPSSCKIHPSVTLSGKVIALIQEVPPIFVALVAAIYENTKDHPTKVVDAIEECYQQAWLKKSGPNTSSSRTAGSRRSRVCIWLELAR